MATVTFTGDPRFPRTDPDQVVMHGIAFPLREPVTVDDAAIAAKLASHSHFTVEAKASNIDSLAKARAAKAARRAM